MAKVTAISQNLFVLAQKSGASKRWLDKKAVERLCDKNLLLSLAIAFLVVIASAQILSWFYHNLAAPDNSLWRDSGRLLYMLEKG